MCLSGVLDIINFSLIWEIVEFSGISRGVGLLIKSEAKKQNKEVLQCLLK